jgi:hypothetical protein
MLSKDLSAELDISYQRLDYWRKHLLKRDIIHPNRVEGSLFDYAEEDVEAFRKLKTLLENGVQTVPEATHLIHVDQTMDNIRFDHLKRPLDMNSDSEPLDQPSHNLIWLRLWSALFSGILWIKGQLSRGENAKTM